MPMTVPSPTSVREAAPVLPRLLAGLPPRGAWRTLAEHRLHYPRPPLPAGKPRTQLIDQVEQAGLRGRGGAGFPTAIKMASVAAGRGRPVVVANGTEGEPASYKDRMLLMTQPHLVLDGALVAAAAVGADQVFIGVESTATAARNALHRALEERAGAERSGPEIRLVPTPPGYVSGEESALVQFLNAGIALPTAVPPRPYERGVGKRPTLINNVETLAHLAMIAAQGPAWFRQAGTREEPGTMLLTVSGAVSGRGVVEIGMGATLAEVIERASPTARPAAALVGGFFGTWVAPNQFDLPISRAGLAPAGAAPGCGVLIVLPEGACGLAETVRIMRWYAQESAGQCGPCVFGLPAMAKEAESLCYGPPPVHGLARLQRWGSEVEGRGACKHPDGAVRLLRSALRVFGADVDHHLRGFPCPGSRSAPLIAVPGVQASVPAPMPMRPAGRTGPEGSAPSGFAPGSGRGSAPGSGFRRF